MPFPQNPSLQKPLRNHTPSSQGTKTYLIGTRGSLLAITQAKLIQTKLQALTGDRFEIVTIKTEGDSNTDAPLWQLEGSHFFTKELDTALLSGKVDLVVHSYKDLGSKRPPGIELAAVSKRFFPNDILLVKKETLSRLNELRLFMVGTSSPRRIVNLENHLALYLPSTSPLKVQARMLRGNVTTRIQKLQEGGYHAIALALAGLERLATGEESKKTLEQLLRGLDYLVLPQSQFPSAAAQGALAVECKKDRNDGGALLEKIKLIEDTTTREEVQRERESFHVYGGGCHLAIGVCVKKIGDYFLHIHRGKLAVAEGSERERIEKMYLEPPIVSLAGKYSHVFIGLPPEKALSEKKGIFHYDELISKVLIDSNEGRQKAHFFVTSNYCLPAFKKIYGGGSIWVSGDKTFKKLVQRGFWVNGSSDSLGHESMEEFQKSYVLALLNQAKGMLPWKVLTHDASTSRIGQTIPCYTRKINVISLFTREKIKRTRLYYWTSFFQYQTYVEHFPHLRHTEVRHCCGLGKTYAAFKKHAIEVLPFFDIKGFKKWVENRGNLFL